MASRVFAPDQLRLIERLIDGGQRTTAVEEQLDELRAMLHEIRHDIRRIEHEALRAKGAPATLAADLNKRRGDEREVLKVIRRLDF